MEQHLFVVFTKYNTGFQNCFWERWINRLLLEKSVLIYTPAYSYSFSYAKMLLVVLLWDSAALLFSSKFNESAKFKWLLLKAVIAQGRSQWILSNSSHLSNTKLTNHCLASAETDSKRIESRHGNQLFFHMIEKCNCLQIEAWLNFKKDEAFILNSSYIKSWR